MVRHLELLVLIAAISACSASSPEAGHYTALDSVDAVLDDTASESVNTVFSACEVGSGMSSPDLVLSEIDVVIDPYELTALTAVVTASHEALSPGAVEQVVVGVLGTDGGADLIATLETGSDAYRTMFDEAAFAGDDQVAFPVLGLYADHVNTVGFELRTEQGVFYGCIEVATEAVEDRLAEQIIIERSAAAEPGWTYLNEWVFDETGAVRWVGPKIYQVLDDGTLLVEFDQVSWLGRPLVDRTLPNSFRFHHDLIQLPGDTIAACVSRSTTTEITLADGSIADSKYDQIVELAADRSDIVNVWDMRAFLDVDRDTVTAKAADWLHMNTLLYDATADALIVSGRYQGIISVSRGGEQGEVPNQGKALRWLIAPHLDWGAAGWDGQSELLPAEYLLTAVDASGEPYSQAVQDNLEAPPPERDPFFWPIGQHGLRLTHRAADTLRLILFNNQASVLFNGPGTVDNGVSWGAQGDQSNDREGAPYSQIAEYEIDEEAMTVRLVWSYGEEQAALYGSHAGGVNLGSVTGNRFMITTGFDQHDDENPYNPIVLEITEDGAVASRLEGVTSKHTAYRGGRVDLYAWAAAP